MKMFDAEKAIKYCQYKRKDIDVTAGELKIIYLIQNALEHGLVSERTNNSQVNKSETITISRKVAKEWVKYSDEIDWHNDRDMVNEIKQALSKGRNG